MKIVAKYDGVVLHTDEAGDPDFAEGYRYDLLKCPACNQLEFRRYYCHSSDDEPPAYETLYPTSSKGPLGLPPDIQKEYEAARLVRNTSANAYGVLMGRVLELVCEDRKATGRNLYGKLADLAKKNEIPTKLVGVADKLRDFRNFGAHAALGELTAKEVPILENLARAILEYVYSAPHLAEQAEKALEELKNREKKTTLRLEASKS